MKKNKLPLKIGFFDSGLGGLSLVKEILKSSIHCHCFYLADTQNFPYGNQKTETIIKNSYQNIRFLEEKKLDLIIIACHTVSAVALPLIKDHFSIPLVSMIPTSTEKAIGSTKTKIVGIMGTLATVVSLAYNQSFKKKNPTIKLFSKPFSSLATIIEKGSIDTNFLYGIIRDYFDGFFFKEMDSIILGCTHFSILKPLIHNIIGKSVALIDPAMTIVDYLEDIYRVKDKDRHDSENNSVDRLTIYVTRFFRDFEKKSQFFLDKYDSQVSIEEISAQPASIYSCVR